MEELGKFLRAMLLLKIWSAQQVAERNGVAAPKFELILADSGFSIKEIADLLGKSPAAAAKAVARAKAARRGGQSDDQSELGGSANAG